ncbi:MAG: hypothetical protein CSA74_09235 [Rhodobacterales bacterium]|nr:MAG: hypothetical protein CSA74_09235 [Rhodobacterales bacterium]
MHDSDRNDSATARLAGSAVGRRSCSGSVGGAAASGKERYRAGLRGDDAPAPATTGLPPAGGMPPASPTGVFAAVEAAVRKSRIEFAGRLQQYREKLDRIRLRGAAVLPDAAMDEAQFIAHRIAGVGKTLGYAALGDAARVTETAILTWKQEQSDETRQAAFRTICTLAGLIGAICDDG